MGQKRAKTIPFLVFLTQIAIGIAPANLHLESAHGAMVVVHCACKSSSRIGSWDDGRGALRLQILISNRFMGDGRGALRLPPPVLRTLPPWRLVFLEGKVVSAASYPVQACDDKKLGRRSWSFLFQTDHWPMAWCIVSLWPMLGIKKCLSQAVQELKPKASSFNNPWSSLQSGVTRG